MNKVTLPLAAVALVGLYAGIASAEPCSYDSAPAKGVKGSLVRAYAPCPGTEHPTTNTTTEGGTPACTPATPKKVDGDTTHYSFADDGTCAFQSQAKLVSDCSKLKASDGSNLGAQAGPCHVTYIKTKCKGILAPDGVTLIDHTASDGADDNWSVATLSRTTLDDDTNGQMTVIDFPVTFIGGEAKAGGFQIKGNSAEALKILIDANSADLPTCTNIEIMDVTLRDPNGRPFARLGGATVEGQ